MEKEAYFLFILVAFSACGCVWGANILYIASTASPSHTIWDKTLALALRDKGHIITFVTLCPAKNEANFSVIFMEDVYEQVASGYDFESFLNTTSLENIDFLFEWLLGSCQSTLESKILKDVINLSRNGKKFDIIVMDVTSGLCFYPLVEMFGNPPLVATSPFGIPPFLTSSFGIDLHSSFVPNYVMPYTGQMSFFQRINNYFLTMYEVISKSFYTAKLKKMLDKYYERDVNIYEVEKNFSIFLPNYDPVLDYPRPLPPDVIPVGGLHTKRAKALPSDLQMYLDNSKHGVIIFSLGTNVRSDKLKESKKKILLESLAKLEQNVIWKFESDISDLPKNVIVRKFLPQNDILGSTSCRTIEFNSYLHYMCAHPNLKLLINHAGGLSTQEAMYHGVPLVTIPFVVDQRSNAYKVVNRKIGLSLDYENLNVDEMVSTIKEVLRNPIYKQNAQDLSRRYRDRPDSPLDRAVFWVEYVLRHGNSRHLRLPAREMSFYQVELLDIWLFIAAIPILVIIITVQIYCILKNGQKCKKKVKAQ